jgi:dipeptidyl aminopeptidase/acylaminoacyl peptidase
MSLVPNRAKWFRCRCWLAISTTLLIATVSSLTPQSARRPMRADDQCSFDNSIALAVQSGIAASGQSASEVQMLAVHAPKPPIPLAEYFKIHRTAGASFNFDESLIAYSSDEGGRMDIWIRPLAGSGPAKQLTHVKGLIESFEFSPKEDLLVFAADIGGDELMQLYFTDSTGKDPVALFPEDPKTSRSDFIRWSEDVKTFLYTSSRRDAKHMDLYEYDLSSKKSTLLWQASDKLEFALSSRDHKQFVLNEEVSDADTNLYVIKRGDQTPVLLTPHKSEITYTATDLSPDGKTLYYTSDEAGEFTALRAIDLETKKSTSVLSPSWDVFDARFSRGGRYFFTKVDVDGVPEARISDAKTKKPLALPATCSSGFMIPVAFSRSDRWLAARLESDVAPRTLWVIDLKGGVARRVFDPLPESLKGQYFAAATSVRVKSFDGRFVPAFLYAPKGAGPFPAVLDIHGGPTEQSVRSFRIFTQYLVSKGYVVLVPNVRGSAGYGKTYTKLDDKDFGGGPLKDVLACKTWLVSNAHVDETRVAIMGASYGGYMTLAAATFAPTEFAAHVDLFGPSDLKSLVQSFPTYWASSATYIYKKFGNPNDPRDAQYQHDRSPLNYVDKIERPLLVVQGANDARVKKDQSDRLVEALRKRDVPVEYLVIEGEGHGFSKTENQQRALETADRFFDKYIFGDTEVTVLP